MERTLDYYINRLPPFIGKEIFKYLIRDANSITFNTYSTNPLQYHIKYDMRSLKYEVAYRLDRVVENLTGVYLCRIPKKNGKHRYYLSREIQRQYCKGCGEEGCNSYDCRGGYYYERTYDTKYVGKDIDRALLELDLNTSK